MATTTARSKQPPPVRRLGTELPWVPPRDFRKLTRYFKADQRWIVVLRGIDYRRSDTLMRDHLARWAREHNMQVETRTIADMYHLDEVYRQIGKPGEGRARLAAHEVVLGEDESPGMLMRFKVADGQSFSPAGEHPVAPVAEAV